MNTKIAGAAVQNVRIDLYHRKNDRIVAEVSDYGMKVIFRGGVTEAVQFLSENSNKYNLVNGLEALNDLNTIFRGML